MWKQILAMAVLGACGGHKPVENTTTTTTDTSNTPEAHDQGGNMIPPEKMDEVTHDLQRKEMIVSRCMATAMETGDVPRGTHGHVRF
jgi:hypothetical protein